MRVEPEERLRLVAEAAHVDLGQGAQSVLSYSNDVWLIGDTVLRICSWGGRDHLRREAVVVKHLPEAVPHAEVLADGETEGQSWMLTRRLPGQVLTEAWGDMERVERQAAVTQLGQVLRALHGWVPPDHVARALVERPTGTDTESVIAADLNPLRT
jgi:aminoglycoside phosphotransferase